MNNSPTSNKISVRRILVLLVPSICLLLWFGWVSIPSVQPSPSLITISTNGTVRLGGVNLPSGPVRDVSLRVISRLSKEPVVRVDLDGDIPLKALTVLTKAGTNWVYCVHAPKVASCAYEK